MSEAEKVWGAKADDELLAAARQLAEYTEEGQRVIRAELRRRGFDEARAMGDDELLAAARRLAEYTEEGERVIRAGLRRGGFDEPPAIIRHPDAGGEPQTSISRRYTDAYRVAGAIITFGAAVKVVGAVVAAIIAVGGLASSEQLGIRGLIGGLLLGAMVGLVFWIAGVFVTAQGQLLRASLDTAVNTSPLFSNTEKAKMMGITQSTANV